MAKIKNNPKCFKILVIVIVVIFAFSHLYRVTFGTINEYISDLGIVWSPSSPANRFHYSIISIDIFEYWVFSLNKSEKEKISNDLKDGNWNKLENNHIDKLDYFSKYKTILGNSYKKHDCYICIYDCKNDEVITNSENMIFEDTTKWIVFLYDTKTNKYFCIHQTM